MSSIHIYTANHQEATRYVDDCAGTRRVIMNAPGALIRTRCCEKKCRAKYLTVQVFYDCLNFWCKPNYGCQRLTAAHKMVAKMRREGVPYKTIADCALVSRARVMRLMREYWQITRRTNLWRIDKNRTMRVTVYGAGGGGGKEPSK